MASHSLNHDEGEDTDDELAVTFDAKPVVFTWRVENFSQKKADTANIKVFSDEWTAGSALWRLLLFPNGNPYDRVVGEQLSLYLDVPDKDTLPKGWKRDARFWLSVIDQKDASKSHKMESQVTLHSDRVDYGFPRLMQLSKITDPNNGFLVDDVLVIEAELVVQRVYVEAPLYYGGSYSRRDLGYVGLCNQGATCYLNSLMQGLFHLGVFRRAVYLMSTAKDDVKVSIPLALQRLFYKMQFDDHAPTTKELTRSFGWSDYESFKQHDVQELNRVLMDNLETKMKGTPVQEAEGYIEHLFTGQMENFIRCVNVPYKSSRPEVFYDLGLVVKGMKDIYQSIDAYVALEMMEGQNKYDAEGYGLQDAERGVRFLKMPPVLNVQLKRWEMDWQRMQPYKVNDLYMFYPTLDMTKYLDRSINQQSGIYHLHAVLVHSGGVGGGHYYAYVRPSTKNKWLKFNDQSVSAATEKEAIDDNWGGEETIVGDRYGQKFSHVFQRCANAYMLIYVRETEAYRYMNDDCLDVIPPHLSQISEEYLMTDLRIATEKDLFAHDQTNFDLIQASKIVPQRHKKTDNLESFKAHAAEVFGIPVANQRYWVFQRRGTINSGAPIRPLRSLKPDEALQQIQYLGAHAGLENFLLLLPADADPATGVPPPIGERDSDILLFLKYYDPVASKVSYIGHTIVSSNDDNFNTVEARFRNLAGQELIPANRNLLAWEEINGSEPRLKQIVPGLSFRDLELRNGDIIVYMLEPLPGDAPNPHPTPVEWYPFIRDRLVVEFRPILAQDDVSKRFSLECQKSFSYEDVQKAVGAHLGADPAKIRFTGHMAGNFPRHQPCERTASLPKMIRPYSEASSSDILYFEVLTARLDQIDQMKRLKIEFQCANTKPLPPIMLYVPKNGHVKDIFPFLIEQKEVKDVLDSDPALGLTTGTKSYRIYESWSSKFGKIFGPNDLIAHMTQDYTKYMVQETNVEEMTFNTETDIIANVYHISPAAYQFHSPLVHGIPFMIVMKKNEQFSSVKERIRKKLQISEEEYNTWKFFHCAFTQLKPLSDTTVVGDFSWDRTSSYLALEHPDPSVAARTGANMNSGTYSTGYTARRETGIVIKN